MAFEKAHAERVASRARGASSPSVAKSAAVLAAVKDKPSRAAEVAVLDRYCARWRALRVGRDGRMSSAGAEHKDGTETEKEVDAPSLSGA